MSDATSMKLDTGSPVFPFVLEPSEEWCPGMTLRDYFAARAMAEMIRAHRSEPIAARAAYAYADAMIAERDGEAIP